MNTETCPLCHNPLLDGDAVLSRQGLTFHAGCGEGPLAYPVVLESLHQRLLALEKPSAPVDAGVRTTAPGAGDEATLCALGEVHLKMPRNKQGYFPVDELMRAILEAIKSRKVPRVYYTSSTFTDMVCALTDEVCKLRARVAELEAAIKQMVGYKTHEHAVRHAEQMLAERDAALAVLALANEDCREKQAAIEKFLEDEHINTKTINALRAEVAALKARKVRIPKRDFGYTTNGFRAGWMECDEAYIAALQVAGIAVVL